MKTLLSRKKQQSHQEDLNTQKGNNIISQQILYPQLKQQNRITSAYYSSKLIKGLPLSATPYVRPIQKVPQLQYPFFQEPPQIQVPEIITDELSKQTQAQEQEFEVRAVTAPEVPRPKVVQDFKSLIQRVPISGVKYQQTFIQNQFPEFIHNFEEFNFNPHVHKHLERLKSSTKLLNYQQLPRNQSSKLERQRDIIEKSISNRPIKSQQIKKRTFFSDNRPKTSKIQQTNHQRETQLSDCWKELAQKVVDQGKEHSIKQEVQDQEQEKSLTHLDLESNVLTQKEKDYISKKRKQFLENLKPYIEMKQQQAEKKRVMGNNEVLLENFDQHNTLLSELNEDCNQVQEDSYEMFDDDIQIFDKPLVQQQNFFSKVDPLNKSFEHQLKETQQKFDQMVKEDNKLYEASQKNKIDKPAQYLKVGDHFSLDEINLTLRELNKPVDDRNYELLDSICKNLKFFWQFSQQTRILLLKLSSLVEYKCGQYIFYEGDVGEQMYIILNGACHVRIQNPHIVDCNPIVSTLYTGQQFGELALIDPNTKINRPEQNQLHQNNKYSLKQIRQEIQREEQQKEKAKNWWKKDYNEDKEQETIKIQPKRSASIECAVDTYLLAISRDYFKSIILNVITSELEDKLKTLLTMPCFDFLSQMELIPIANLLESETYRLGQVILKEGEQQKYFYIIASGRCKCVKEEVFIRDLKSMRADDPNRKKPLKCGLIDYAQQREDTKMRVKNTQLDLQGIQGLSIPQSFQYQEIYKNKEYMAFKYHFHYRELARGDFFMGRVLLNEYKAFDEDIMEMKYDLTEKSRLTVISDAAKTEVYKLDKGLFHLITQPLKQHLIDGIKRKQEFDHVFDEQEGKKVKEWDSYKMNLFKAVMEQKELKLNK